MKTIFLRIFVIIMILPLVYSCTQNQETPEPTLTNENQAPLTSEEFHEALEHLAKGFIDILKDEDWVMNSLIPTFQSEYVDLREVMRLPYNGQTVREAVNLGITKYTQADSESDHIGRIFGNFRHDGEYIPSAYIPNIKKVFKTSNLPLVPGRGASRWSEDKQAKVAPIYLEQNGEINEIELNQAEAHARPVLLINNSSMDINFAELSFIPDYQPVGKIDNDDPSFDWAQDPGTYNLEWATGKIEQRFERTGQSEVYYRASLFNYDGTSANHRHDKDLDWSDGNDNNGLNIESWTRRDIRDAETVSISRDMINGWPNTYRYLALLVYEYDWPTGVKTTNSTAFGNFPVQNQFWSITHRYKPKYEKEVYFSNFDVKQRTDVHEGIAIDRTQLNPQPVAADLLILCSIATAGNFYTNPNGCNNNTSDDHYFSINVFDNP